MSSQSPNPYQSRLFNFLNRQSLRLKEQVSRTGRNLKIAVELGIQILLYPLYLLIQTIRMAERQLNQRVQQKNILKATSAKAISPPQLTPEYPINQVVETVNTWLQNNPVEITSDNQLLIVSETKQNLVIQSVASNLDNHQLALVTPENQLLELSQEHHHQLLQLICWELANYQYQFRFYSNAKQKHIALVSSFQTDSSTILPPIRWFWRGVRWMQLSPIARGVNLFGESNLIRQSFFPLEDTVSLSTLREYYHDNKSINHTREANLAHNNFFSASNFTNVSLSENSLSFSRLNWQQMKQIVKTAVEHFFYQGTLPNLSQLELVNDNNHVSSVSEINQISLAYHNYNNAEMTLYPTSYMLHKQREYLQKSSNLFISSAPENWQILVLIQAAIDYFFTKQRRRYFAHSSNSLSSAIPSPTVTVSALISKPLAISPEPDPWLSTEDIFPQSSPSSNNNNYESNYDNNNSHNLPLLAANKPQLNSVNEPIIDNIKTPIIKLKLHTITRQESQSLTEQKPLTKSLNQSEKKSSIITPVEHRENADNADNKVEYKSDWIETKATSVGYVKHPLVRILEMLDKIILWLEEILLKIWRWLKKFLR